MKRFLLIPAVGVLASLAMASAASLGGITTPTIAASDADVASCDPNGVSVTYTTAFVTAAPPALGHYDVTSIDVGDVHADCAGLTLEITLTKDSDGSVISTESVAATSPITTVAILPTVTVADVGDIHIVIQ